MHAEEILRDSALRRRASHDRGRTYDDLLKADWDVLCKERQAFIAANLEFLTSDSEAPLDTTATFDEVSIVYLYVLERGGGIHP